MNTYVIGLASGAILLIGGVASAQVTSATSAPATVPPTIPATVGYGMGLGVMLNAAQSVPAGGHTAALALIAFDATRIPDNVAIPTLPLALVFDGAPASDFTNCALRSVNNLGVALNTGQNVVPPLTTNAVAVTFGLDAPLVVPAGSSQVIALTCDIAPGTPTGSVTISINPASIPAADMRTGATIVPAADVIGPSATPGPTYGTVAITPAGASANSASKTPGVPNTGAGGESGVIYAVLAFSAAVFLLGSRMLFVRVFAQRR